MATLRISRYSASFKKPFLLAGNSFKERTGLLIALIDDKSGQQFWGEAAPLPGFSTETEDDVLECIKESDPNLFGFSSDVPPMYPPSFPPSLNFALSAIWFSRRAAQNKMPLQHFLAEGRAHPKLAINTTIGLAPPEAMLESTREGITSGFSTFKYKVGENPEQEAEAISMIRDNYPDIRIRLDANGAWNTDQALKALKTFEPFDIEYIEQPLPPGNDEADAWLRNQTFIPIAADESVRSFTDAQRIIKMGLADILIIKPMLLGSVTAFLDILEMAQKAKIQVVVTTSLDSGIARRATAQLASVIRHSKHAQGLSTGSVFADAQDPCGDGHLIENGYYLVSEIETEPKISASPETLYEITV